MKLNHKNLSQQSIGVSWHCQVFGAKSKDSMSIARESAREELSEEFKNPFASSRHHSRHSRHSRYYSRQVCLAKT